MENNDLIRQLGLLKNSQEEGKNLKEKYKLDYQKLNNIIKEKDTEIEEEKVKNNELM